MDHRQCVIWLKVANGKVQSDPDIDVYTLLEKRQDSFKFFLPYTWQERMQLAESGFIYTREGDKVICYHCSLTLQNLNEETHVDPWRVHAELFPYCAHIRLCKGDKYILDILEQQPANVQQPRSVLENTNERTDGPGDHEEDVSLAIDELKKENESLKHSMACKICYDRQACIVALPCGHIVSCAQCFPALKKCPFCRKEMPERIRVSFGKENVP